MKPVPSQQCPANDEVQELHTVSYSGLRNKAPNKDKLLFFIPVLVFH